MKRKKDEKKERKEERDKEGKRNEISLEETRILVLGIPYDVTSDSWQSLSGFLERFHPLFLSLSLILSLSLSLCFWFSSFPAFYFLHFHYIVK